THATGDSLAGAPAGSSTTTTTGSGSITHDNGPVHVAATVSLISSSTTTTFDQNAISGAYDKQTEGSSHEVRSETVDQLTLHTQAAKTIDGSNTEHRRGNSV